MNGLDLISTKEYWGRFIILGTINNNPVMVYGVTGRSQDSRERILVEEERDNNLTIKVDPTKEVEKKIKEGTFKGNPDLIFYDAIAATEDGGIVTNGAQTKAILDKACCFSFMVFERKRNYLPGIMLMNFLKAPYIVKGVDGEDIDLTLQEPDSMDTPRINGISCGNNGALSITKLVNGVTETNYFCFPLVDRCGKFIATYDGTNLPSGQKLGSFRGEPLDVMLVGNTSEEIASRFYDALGPKEPGPGIIEPGKDIRVGVAAVICGGDKGLDYHIINREGGAR